MANKFPIVISAVDNATKTIRGVKNSLSSVTRPVANLKKSVAGFSKEAGLSRVANSFVVLGRSGAEVGAKLGVLAGPMAAIGGATSIAGIASLASEWGRLGIEAANAAAAIGIGSEKLSAMQGASQLAGASSAGMTKGLKTLGDTMEDALYGRNQQALVLMSRLGITMHRTADGAMDTERAFSDLADAISRQDNPQVQGIIARTLGLEDQLPLLRQGAAGVAELKRQVHELSGVTDDQIQAAANFGKAQGRLGVAISGVGNVIEQRLIPRFQPIIEGMTSWIAKHREAVANITEVGVSLAIVAGIAAAVAVPFGVIGGVIAAVAAAMVAAVALIYTHWDGIAGFFKAKWDGVKSAFDQGFLQGVVKVIREFNPVSLMADAMNGLVKWLFDFDLGAAGRHVVQTLLKAMHLPDNIVQLFGPDAASTANASTSAPPAPTPSAAQAKPAAAPAAAQQPQKVHVELDVKGLPKGSEAKAKTGMGTYLPTRVHYGMPNLVGT